MSFLTAIWTMSGCAYNALFFFYSPADTELRTAVTVELDLSVDDAPFHLSEECSNSQIATPRAIVMTSFLGGTLGWFLCLVIVRIPLCVPDHVLTLVCYKSYVVCFYYSFSFGRVEL